MNNSVSGSSANERCIRLGINRAEQRNGEPLATRCAPAEAQSAGLKRQRCCVSTNAGCASDTHIRKKKARALESPGFLLLEYYSAKGVASRASRCSRSF